MRNSLQRTSQILSVVVITASLCAMAGWQFRIPLLKAQFAGSFIAPNTALFFLLSAVSILLQGSRRTIPVFIGRAIGFFIFVFAYATLHEWMSGADLGIDRIFFAHRLSDWYLPVPGRFAVNSAVSFILAGTALVTLRTRTSLLLSECCSSLILLISYGSIIGYIYSVRAFYASGNVMAVASASIFVLLAMALLTAADGQVAGILSSPFAGGIVSRRFILTVAIVMPVLGMIAVWARSEYLVSREQSIAVLVLISVAVFSGLALRTAITLNRIDQQRLQTQDALRYTEQLQAESLQQIKLNLKRIELIEGAVNVGTWEFDATTGVSHWPAGISALWGLPPEEHVVPLPEFVERMHPDDRERVAGIVQDAIATGESYDVEFRVIWPDKSIHWLAARGAAVRDETGKITKVLGIALEVTERHQTEKTLRESEKLAAAGRLAATIAHEINNPLEAVVNLVYLAKMDPGLADSTRNVLDTADVELARVTHMVRQTLGFYRESRNPVWVDLAAMAQELVGFYRNKLVRKNIRLTLRAKPASLYGFEGELRQVVSNLISNAIDAAPLNGRIAVHIGTIGKFVRVTVGDNGHGITPENRARLFQPFFTTKSDVGTGLGLWVSKGIVDKHNGTIRIRTSTKDGGCGTVFAITFPAQAIEKVAQSATLAG